jgi:integrase
LWERKLLGEDQAPWRFLNRRRKPQRVRPKEFIRRDERDEISVKMGERHPRDEHFVRGLYGSARRIGELLAMKVGDIDLTTRPGMPRGIFTFDHNKGRRRRVTLPIPPDFHRELKE